MKSPGWLKKFPEQKIIFEVDAAFEACQLIRKP